MKMKKIAAMAAAIALGGVFCSLDVSAKILSGDDTSGGGAGSGCPNSSDNTYWYDSGHLAWFKFDYIGDPSDSTVAQVSAMGSPIGKGGTIYIEEGGESCTKYSTSFYVSGYVAYTCGSKSFTAAVNRNWNGVYYSGGLLGFQHGGTYIIDSSSEGYPTSGYPAYVKGTSTLVASGKTVMQSKVQAAWEAAGGTGSVNSHTWFCGGEKLRESAEGYFKGTASIKIDSSHMKNSWDSNSVTYVVEGTGEKTVSFTASGTVSQDTEKNASVPVSDTYKLYTSPPKWRFAATGDGGFDQSTATASRNGSITINPGESKLVCSYNTYETHYKMIQGDGGWTGDTKAAEACITVKYDNTKVELGSVSQVSVTAGGATYDAISIEPATKNQLSTKNFGTELIGVGLSLASQTTPETVNADVTSGPVSVMAMNKITKEKIVSGSDTDLTLRDITVTNPMRESHCGPLSGNFMDCYKSSSGWDAGMIFPGQTRTFTAQTKHPAEISSSAVTDPTQESSTATVTLTAAPIQCADFGNKDIGASNPTNYGRIAFSGPNYRTIKMAGDMEDGSWRANDTVWTRPMNSRYTIGFKYYYCMGNQILQDADGAGYLHDYVVDSTVSLDSLLYNAVPRTNVLSTRSVSGKNVNATELGREPADRILSGYQGTAGTGSQYPANSYLGKSFDSTFEWKNGTQGNSKATITVNTPYNYYLDPIANYNDSGEGIVYLDQTPTFEVGLNVVGRKNPATAIDLSTEEEEYKTGIKNTKISVTKLYLADSVTLGDIENINNMPANEREGDWTDRVGEILSSKIGPRRWETVGEPITKGPSTQPSMLKINGNNIVQFDAIGADAVGKKVFVAVAIFPSDSHNTGNNASIGINDDQSMALAGPNGYGSNPKTSFKVSCATVGKKPSVSIEGGSLTAGGQVNGSQTTYHNRIFGSWAEYDLLSSGGSYFGSGASLAYGSFTNGRGMNDAIEPDSGLPSDELRYPQSIGNTNATYGSSTEVAAVVSRSGTQANSTAWKFASDIKARYIDIEPNDSRVRVFNRDKGATFDDALNTLANNDGVFVIYYNGHNKDKFEINNSIVNNQQKSILLIYSEGDILIDGSVTRIDAFLVADASAHNGEGSSVTVATIDTCKGALNRQNVGYGNENLYYNCGNQLVINGAVATNAIDLDRSYGGGSLETDDEGYSYLDPDLLTVRAEVFNYDPRINYWSYELIKKTTNYEASYAKELSPRL